MEESYPKEINLFIYLFFLSLIFNFIAYRFGFFSFRRDPDIGHKIPLTNFDVLKAFLIILLTPFGVAFLSAVILMVIGKDFSPLKPWLSALTYIFTVGFVALFALKIDKEKRLWVWGRGVRNPFSQNIKVFFIGVFTWFIAYPAAFAFGELFVLGVTYFWGPISPSLEQNSISFIQSTLENKLLLSFTAISMSFLVPIGEELVFRGFLQTRLIKLVGLGVGILLTALFFSCLHFSLSQKMLNWELIPTLFILACYLGFLMEKYGNIWAPIGLHMAFNTITIASLIVTNA